MGGCRCTFRQCTNNTINSPGKHFFHFPYKDNERCKKWALNSNNISFLKLPWTQLRNKTVCEDHFVDSNFMNYKKERLIKTAVPTLIVGSDGIAHECEVDDDRLSSLNYSFNDKGNDPKAIDLPDAQQTKRTLNLKLENSQTEDNSTSIILNDWNEVATTRKATADTSPKMDLKPIVLNRTCGKPVRRFAVRNVQEKCTTKRLNHDSPESSGVKQLKLETDKRDTTPIIIAKTYGNRNSSNNLLVFQDLDNDAIESPTSPETNLPDSVTANLLEKMNHIEERDANKVDKSLYMQMMAEHAKQIEDLKKLLTDKFTEQKEIQTQKVASSTSSSSADGRTIRVEKGPAMTKVQLFNGIRKYLNPTMVALLRMEMFGSSDREYRPDEKQLSKELYNLNQNVYDYMRDEWRFRLPPKSAVETWLKTPDDEETWELC